MKPKGEVAYEAFCAAMGEHGPHTPFPNHNPHIQVAWAAVEDAVRAEAATAPDPGNGPPPEIPPNT
jgi:hypothetical protein